MDAFEWFFVVLMPLALPWAFSVHAKLARIAHASEAFGVLAGELMKHDERLDTHESVLVRHDERLCHLERQGA